jgi:hypothetical protein
VIVQPAAEKPEFLGEYWGFFGGLGKTAKN